MAKKSDELRRKAEEILAIRKSMPDKHLSDLNVDRLLEELSVFQIELELQNEELLRKQTELEISKNEFENLFNTAPNGYLVIDKNLIIKKCNQTFATLVGLNIGRVVNSRFSEYLMPEYQDELYLKCRNLFKMGGIENCEIVLKTSHNEKVFVRLDGSFISNKADDFVRISVIDITLEKMNEREIKEKNTKILTQNEELQAQNEQLSQQNEEIVSANLELIELNKQLNFQKAKAQSYLDLAGVMFVAVGGDEKVFLANQKATEILGYSQKEIIGKNWFDNFLPVSQRELVRGLFHKIIAGEIRSVDEYENDILNRHGESRLILWRNTILRDIDGKPVGTLSSGADITERRKAENKLRKSEEQYRTLIETANEGFWLMDENHVTVHVNEAMTKMIGYSETEMVGERVEKFFFEEDMEFHKQRMANRHRGEDEIYERRFRRKDGTELWTLVSAKALKNPDETFAGSFALFTDITARKYAVEALKQSEMKFRTYIENSPTAVFIANETGKYLFVNSSASSLLGYSVGELNNMSIPQILPESELQKGLADFNKVKTTGYSENNELKFKKKDGVIIDVLIASVKLKEGEYMAYCRDITELKNTQRELLLKNEEYQQLNEELQQNIETIREINEQLEVAKGRAEESDRLKSAFLANMSHEIRTPMNGILGFAELLKEPDLSGEEQQKYISIIEKSGQRMLNIINDLIDISKIEAGQMEVHTSLTNINGHLSTLFVFFRPEAERKNIRLSFTCALPDAESIILTDSEKIYAILTNLIKNAIKYTHQGSIEFGYHKKNGRLAFFVKDTGIGIRQEKLGAIFERFVQADTMITKPYEGAGLGLSISKAYVAMLGGEIWVESEFGNGSTFWFSIPYIQETQEPKPTLEAIKADADKSLKKLNVLIAEDTEASDVYLTQIVKKISASVSHVTTGDAAVAFCRDHPETDLVLMDIKMPVMDGYEATKRIREFNRNIVIIAQTSYALTGDREKSLEAGCNDHISKPLKKIQLLEMIMKYF